MTKQKGSRDLQKNVMRGVLIVVILIIFVAFSIIFSAKGEAEPPAGEEGNDVLYVTRITPIPDEVSEETSRETEATAKHSSMPVTTGMESADAEQFTNHFMRDISLEENWQYGTLAVPNTKCDVYVVIEYTNLLAAPEEIFLYREEGYGSYSPCEMEAGKAVFFVQTLNAGEWIIAMRLPMDKNSLGTSVTYILTEQEYKSRFAVNEEELLPRDETGGAITDYSE